MLHFILGRASTGKSKRMCEILKDELDKKTKNLSADNESDSLANIILIAPEQFTFECEKRLIKNIGDGFITKISVRSFTSLSNSIQKIYGKMQRPPIDKSSKQLLLAGVLDDLQDHLSCFANCSGSSGAIDKILSTLDELSRCSVSFDTLVESANKSGNETLIKKVEELKIINELYSSTVLKRFSDTRFTLDDAIKIIQEEKCFVGKTIFVDEFYGFTEQQYSFLCELACQADDVYVALCCEGLRDSTGGTGSFSYTTSSALELKRRVTDRGVRVAVPEILGRDRRYDSLALQTLEENLYMSGIEKYTVKTDDVTVISAMNPIDECDTVALFAKKIVRTKNIRYRDIAVIDRSGEYKKYLLNSFKKYGVPVFEDARYSVEGDITVKFIMSLLQLASEGLRQDAIMSLLKTNLTRFEMDDIFEFENYCLIWQKDGKSFREKWRAHPDGYSKEFDDESTERLEKSNEIREFVVTLADGLHDKFKSATATDGAKAIYETLLELGIPEKLTEIYEIANENLKNNTGFAVTDTVYTCGRLRRSWAVTVKVLDNFSSCLGGRILTGKRFLELFTLFVKNLDEGQMPSGIDEITIGRADRIRLSEKKVVFLVGANESKFPLEPGSDFVLTNADKRILAENGIKNLETSLQTAQRERFFVYTSVSMPSERLYVSYSTSSLGSSTMRESEIVTQVLEIIPDCQKIDTDKINPIDRIESKRSAFEVASSLIKTDSPTSTSTREYMYTTEYDSNMHSAEKLGRNTPYEFENPGVALDTFGKNMVISPSRVESYNECPFNYFCKYALGESAIKSAKYDAAINGTLAHFVFEKVISDKENPLKDMNDEQIIRVTEQYINQFTSEQLIDKQQMSKKEIQSLEATGTVIIDCLKRLRFELNLTKFEPVAAEVQIGDGEGRIPPHIVNLDGGGTVKLIGKVDRIDVYKNENSGAIYVRVIDYKTGKKKFSLCDAYHGLNDQMLIYLDAICSAYDKNNYDGGDKSVIPAGVLYMPIRKMPNSVARNASSEDIDYAALYGDKTAKDGQMNGLINEHIDIVEAMGIKVKNGKKKKNDEADEKTPNIEMNVGSCSTEQFSELFLHVDSEVKKMATNLQNGKIPATVRRAKNESFDRCAGCDFRPICLHEPGNDFICEKEPDKELWKILSEEYDKKEDE